MVIPNSSKPLLPILMGVFLVPALPPVKTSANNSPLASFQMNSGIQVAPTLRSPHLLAQQSNFSSFFEDGRVLSENELRRQPPDPTLPVDQNSQFWQPIIFRAGGVSFWMPPGTLTEETVVLPTRLGAVSFRTLAANSDNSRYLVAYAAQLSDEQLKNPAALLVAIVSRVISAQKFTLIQNRPIVQAGSRGRELSYQSDTEVIIFRAFLHGNNAYVIGARSPKSEEVPSRKTTAFLGSLEFLTP